MGVFIIITITPGVGFNYYQCRRDGDADDKDTTLIASSLMVTERERSRAMIMIQSTISVVLYETDDTDRMLLLLTTTKILESTVVTIIVVVADNNYLLLSLLIKESKVLRRGCETKREADQLRERKKEKRNNEARYGTGFGWKS